MTNHTSYAYRTVSMQFVELYVLYSILWDPFLRNTLIQ